MLDEEVVSKLEQTVFKLSEIMGEFMGSRDVIHEDVLINNIVPWILNYRNKKHIYVNSPVATSVSIEEFGTIPIPAQAWTLFDYREGSRVLNPGVVSPATQLLLVKHTDEILPGGLPVASGGGIIINPPNVTVVGPLTTNGGFGEAIGPYIRTLLTNNSGNTSFTSADILVDDISFVDIDVVFTSFTGGTTPSITYNLARKDAFNNYNIIWTSGAKTAAFTTVLTIGPGAQQGSAAAANVASVGIDFGNIIQFSWTTAGAPTSITQASTIRGKSL